MKNGPGTLALSTASHLTFLGRSLDYERNTSWHFAMKQFIATEQNKMHNETKREQNRKNMKNKNPLQFL